MSVMIENGVLLKFDDLQAESYVIPDCVTEIADGAFKGCNNLVSVTIPPTVECIGYDVFEGCTGLSEIHIPDGAEMLNVDDLLDTKWYRDNKDGFLILGTVLLAYGGHEQTIDVPPYVTKICEGVFTGIPCSATVWLPSTLREIEPNAFDANNRNIMFYSA